MKQSVPQVEMELSKTITFEDSLTLLSQSDSRSSTHRPEKGALIQVIVTRYNYDKFEEKNVVGSPSGETLESILHYFGLARTSQNWNLGATWQSLGSKR
jgi:hypothetical protein